MFSAGCTVMLSSIGRMRDAALPCLNTRFIANTFQQRPADILLVHNSPAIPEGFARLMSMYAAHEMGEFIDRPGVEIYQDEFGNRWMAYDLRPGD